MRISLSCMRLDPIIGQFQQEFGHKKPERLGISDKTFGNVPMTGQLSNQFVEGMRKIYELEPFIKLGTSLTQYFKFSALVF